LAFLFYEDFEKKSKKKERRTDTLTVFIGNQSLIFCRRIFMSGVPKEKKKDLSAILE
jgi:hypothetical protein